MGKYDEWSRGDDEALLNRLGGIGVARRIASGELKVDITNGAAVLKTKFATLFDKHGRRIPPSELQYPVVDADCDFCLRQPKLDYGQLIALATERLRQGPIMSGAEFEARATAVLEQVKADPQLANLLKGVHLPIVLPQMKVTDYGRVMEKTFLTAVARAYTVAFPDRNFNNYLQKNLAGKVAIAPNTRHEQLIAKMGAGSVVGIYFPTALQGFSIPASREQMASLPDNILLAGGLDIAMAMLMYTEVLARDFNTPGLDMAALQWDSAAYSLYFKACGSSLYFSHGGLDAYDDCSGGLLLLG
ncbi:MAG: hypothetical protein AAB666_00050 [Patescibacteria group bacterium]